MPPTVTNPSLLPGGPDPAPRRRIPWWFTSLLFVGVGVLLVLARVEPSGQFFYPRCWLLQTTGFQCPSCGATRALHALLNGELTRALQFNALIVLALPIVAWEIGRALRGWGTGRWFRDPVTHPAGLSILAGLTVGFGLARNFSW